MATTNVSNMIISTSYSAVTKLLLSSATSNQITWFFKYTRFHTFSLTTINRFLWTSQKLALLLSNTEPPYILNYSFFVSHSNQNVVTMATDSNHSCCVITTHIAMVTVTCTTCNLNNIITKLTTRSVTHGVL